MTIKELGEKCRARDIDCEECPYGKECEEMSTILEKLSPCGILKILEKTL